MVSLGVTTRQRIIKALIRWTIQVEWFGGKVKKAWLGFII